MRPGADRALLARIAAAGGGRVLDDASQLVAPGQGSAVARWPAGPLLLILAALLWPLEIASRRLVVPVAGRVAALRERVQLRRDGEPGNGEKLRNRGLLPRPALRSGCWSGRRLSGIASAASPHAKRGPGEAPTLIPSGCRLHEEGDKKPADQTLIRPPTGCQFARCQSRHRSSGTCGLCWPPC